MTDVPAPDPTRTALLVMDVQHGIIGRLPEVDAFLDRVEAAIATARGLGLTIGYVRVGFADSDYAEVPAHQTTFRFAADHGLFHADSDDTAIHHRVAPQTGDVVVRKTRVGPFTTTDLREQLDALGIDTLVLAGVSTSGVVLSTVRQAADLDDRVIVLRDAVADPDDEVHRVLLEKVFPRQATVIDTADLAGLFAGA